MTKPTPKDWDLRRDAFQSEMREEFDKYERYAAWRRGDNEDLIAMMGLEDSNEAAPVNMVGLVSQSFRAHLFFNAPKSVVKPLPGLRKADLATVHTRLLNDAMDETRFYFEGRKGLLDGFLGPYMVFKIGYSADVVTDKERVEKDRARAAMENNRLMVGDRVQVANSDIGAVHIEAHQSFLEDVSEERLQLPASVARATARHIDKHHKHVEEHGVVSTETVRGERVWIKRRNPLHV
ncbi:MAG: hypothetical protein GY700_15445, partial [Propionibacteriaceae bacterium]|nr:hypothetical protein [Propionibacteriaceae bacterium]